MIRNKSAVVAVATLMAFGAANPAGATPVNRSFSVTVPLEASLVLEALDCSNAGGHYITVGGTQSGLPAVHGKATFKSPSNKVDTSASDTLLLEAGPTTTIDKRGVGGGVGGNPWIYIAGDGGTPALLGRCVQGFRANWSNTSRITLPIATTTTALDCTVRGSSLDVAATNALSGTQGVTVTFDNKAPDNPSSPRPHKDAASVSLQLKSTSGTYRGARHNGIGGNPDVYLNVSQDAPTSDGVYLGRCRSLL